MKVHLYETDDPLDKPKTVTAVCGTVVSPVSVVWHRDGEVYGKTVIRHPSDCAKCWKSEWEHRRYLYRVVNAEELRQKCGDLE